MTLPCQYCICTFIIVSLPKSSIMQFMSQVPKQSCLLLGAVLIILYITKTFPRLLSSLMQFMWPKEFLTYYLILIKFILRLSLRICANSSCNIKTIPLNFENALVTIIGPLTKWLTKKQKISSLFLYSLAKYHRILVGRANITI